MDSDLLVGVDTGGTFTDFVFLTPTGQIRVYKRASTPADPSESVLRGLEEAAPLAFAPESRITHGTTVATNALLERKGARAALITTQGFRDVLEVGRQARPELYALHPRSISPLIAAPQRFELNERMDWQGEPLTVPDAAEIARVLDCLACEQIESVAVCFLFSYLNPEHERLVGEQALARGLRVSLSSAISPEPREFERTSTTVANAFVAPLMADYLQNLAARLLQRRAEAEGQGSVPKSAPGTLRVMQSNGGTLSPEEASARPIQTVLSGPAGGVVAALHLAAQTGEPNLLTFDMGGTSTDVALIANGQCAVTPNGDVGGLPLSTPLLDIHTVGAGGGSLVRVDAAGGLRVGPQSAGSVPGPVAYGRGDRLTVTDANVLLGRLPANRRLAGTVALDGSRVAAHFAELAATLEQTVEAAAEGALAIVNATMARALRHISTERGHDPVDFTLLSYGGAGGLHACALAESLAMRRVLVPRYPGAFSALGLALADVRREYSAALPASQSAIVESSAWQEAVRTRMDSLYVQARRDMEAEGLAEGAWQAEWLLDMRYVGQSFSLRTPTSPDHLDAAAQTFHDAHRQRYGYASEGQMVEVVAVRLVAQGISPPRTLAADVAEAGTNPVAVPQRVFVAGQWREVSCYERDTLPIAWTAQGPLLILQEDATTWVEAGWKASVQENGSILLKNEG